MFVCNDLKVVFLAVPKTGTRSIYNFLNNGNKNRKLYSEHRIIVPEIYKKYFTFAISRNPYDRICSCYWSLCMRDGDAGGWAKKTKNKFGSNSLWNFLRLIEGTENVINATNPNLKALPFVAQYPFHIINKIDLVLRFENIVEDFHKLFFVSKDDKLGHLNSTKRIEQVKKMGINQRIRPDYKSMIDEKSKSLIQRLYKKDFELLNYEI